MGEKITIFGNLWGLRAFRTTTKCPFSVSFPVFFGRFWHDSSIFITVSSYIEIPIINSCVLLVGKLVHRAGDLVVIILAFSRDRILAFFETLQLS